MAILQPFKTRDSLCWRAGDVAVVACLSNMSNALNPVLSAYNLTGTLTGGLVM